MYTVGSVDFAVDTRHGNAARQAAGFVGNVVDVATMLWALRPGLESIPRRLQSRVARMMTVAVQATMAATRTTSWTAADISSQAAAAIFPQLLPAPPRSRPLVSIKYCLRDARLARDEELDVDAMPQRLAIHRDDSLLQLVTSLMRLRPNLADLNEFYRTGEDLRGRPSRDSRPRGFRLDLRADARVCRSPWR